MPALLVWMLLWACCSVVRAADDSDAESLPEQPPLSAEELEEMQQTALEISQQLQRFEERIAALESELGPYDASLVEVFNDMAQYYLDIGRPQDAVDLYERALNVTRISDGLYSETQLPILEKLTDALRAAADWQTVDDREYLAFHLKSRIYPPGSQGYAEAVMTLARWKAQSLQGNLLQRSSRAALSELDELQSNYVDALLPLPQSPDADEQSEPGFQPVTASTRVSLLHGKAQTEFQFGAYLANTVPSYLRFPVNRYVSEYVCRTVAGPDGQPRNVCGTVRVENPRYYEYEREKSYYRQGIRDALSALRESVASMRALSEQNPELAGDDAVAVSVRLQELETMEQELQRGYRRSSIW